MLRRAVPALSLARARAAAVARPSGMAARGAAEAAPGGRAASPLALQARALGGVGGGIVYPPPSARIAERAPLFTADAVVGGDITTLRLADYVGKWVVLFFYPKDFTFVCPTEIISFSDRAAEFEKLGAAVIAASVDSAHAHLAWVKTPRRRGGLGHMAIPLVSDLTREISNAYGVLKHDEGVAFRGLFLINPSGVLEHMTVNNFPVGRSVDETLRVLQAFQYNEKHGEVCPAGWTPGAKTMVASPEKSAAYFAGVEDGDDWPAGKITAVRSKAELAAAVGGKGKVFVEYVAPWCGKCAMMAPTIAALSESRGDVKFLKVDTTADGLTSAAADASVLALPTFRFYKDGAQVGADITGFKRAVVEEAMAKF